MLNKPQFKRCFHLEIVEPEGIFLLSEEENFLLKGRVYKHLIPLIDGKHTTQEIIELLKDKVPTPEIYYALMSMENKGYIVEAFEDFTPEILAFLDVLNIDTIQAKNRLLNTKVVVSTCSNYPLDSLQHQLISYLESLHIQIKKEEIEHNQEKISNQQTTEEIEIVLTDDYLNIDLDQFNRQALQLNRPWILIKPVGKSIWIGPLFYPGKTGCWECLTERLMGNRPIETFLQKRLNRPTYFPIPKPVLPTTAQTALNLAATEIFKWITCGINPQIMGQIITIDTETLEKKNHTLVKRPQCRTCGNVEYWLNQEPSPIVLKSQKKNFTEGGGHRCLSPETTMKKYEHHISEITGVVRTLARVSPSNNNLINTYISVHNFVISDNLYLVRDNVRGRSGGKGKTDVQSKASGFCEAIERYSGTFQGYEFKHKNSFRNLGNKAIHPNDCMLFSEEQYKNRNLWNSNCDQNQKIPEPFDAECEIDWTPVWSLTHQTWKYLPTAYCYYGYPSGNKPFCIVHSNGCAAGNTLEEAILQGFLELVERDAVSIWWYNRLEKPGVNLDSFQEPYFLELKDYYYSINRSLVVLDITSDLNIPTFAAISARLDQQVEDIIYGFGSHFDSKIAITRAVTEVNQSLPLVLAINPDGSTKYSTNSEIALSWLKNATLENQPYLVPQNNVKFREYSDYAQIIKNDLKEDVMTCVEIAKQKGMEVLVLDQTRPDIGLNVVRVIVPGMRIWRRFAPGRLYDVPVKLGYLPVANTESQLNPFHIMF